MEGTEKKLCQVSKKEFENYKGYAAKIERNWDIIEGKYHYTVKVYYEDALVYEENEFATLDKAEQCILNVAKEHDKEKVLYYIVK